MLDAFRQRLLHLSHVLSLSHRRSTCTRQDKSDRSMMIHTLLSCNPKRTSLSSKRASRPPIHVFLLASRADVGVCASNFPAPQSLLSRPRCAALLIHTACQIVMTALSSNPTILSLFCNMPSLSVANFFFSTTRNACSFIRWYPAPRKCGTPGAQLSIRTVTNGDAAAQPSVLAKLGASDVLADTFRYIIMPTTSCSVLIAFTVPDAILLDDASQLHTTIGAADPTSPSSDQRNRPSASRSAGASTLHHWWT